MSFYSDKPTHDLRFGDVLCGFCIAVPSLGFPRSTDATVCRLRISTPEYYVVMSPCCSIEKKAILIAPLLQIRTSFLQNEFILEDPTRINEPIPADKSLPAAAWDKLSPEDRAARSSLGLQYVFQDCFVFAPHELLKSYPLSLKSGRIQSISHHMLDFAHAFRIECEAIDRDKPAPPGTKLLELSINARSQLRRKLSGYFSRIPEEDLIGL